MVGGAGGAGAADDLERVTLASGSCPGVTTLVASTSDAEDNVGVDIGEKVEATSAAGSDSVAPWLLTASSNVQCLVRTISSFAFNDMKAPLASSMPTKVHASPRGDAADLVR